MKLDEALKIDGALTLAQAKRWIEGDLPEPKRLLYVYGLRMPVFTSDELANADDGLVVHAAMVGEMRRVLGVLPEHWRPANATRVDEGGLEPDAVWDSDRGRIAVEFDAGRYPRKRVEVKLRHYGERYDGQVWGVLSRERIGYVQNLAQKLGVARPPVFMVEL